MTPEPAVPRTQARRNVSEAVHAAVGDTVPLPKKQERRAFEHSPREHYLNMKSLTRLLEFLAKMHLVRRLLP